MAEGRLDDAVERLQRAAEELRSGELSAERAADLVETCARVAAEAAGELDREIRAIEVHGAAEDQLRLDSA